MILFSAGRKKKNTLCSPPGSRHLVRERRNPHYCHCLLLARNFERGSSVVGGHVGYCAAVIVVVVAAVVFVAAPPQVSPRGIDTVRRRVVAARPLSTRFSPPLRPPPPPPSSRRKKKPLGSIRLGHRRPRPEVEEFSRGEWFAKCDFTGRRFAQVILYFVNH